MRLYVTGSAGFVGRWVAQHVAKGAGPWASIELGADPSLDILDTDGLRAAFAAFAPDAILHLAGQSTVPAAIADPRGTANVNVMGTLSLLDAMEQTAPRARLLHVGSGEVYGLVGEQDLPVDEAAPLAPRNPYAASKVAAEMFVRERAARGRIEACCVRSFNHAGPGQATDFVLPSLAMQMARLVVAGRHEGEVVAGDLDCTRDFLDVRDVVEAYRIILEKGEPGAVYNVCSGSEVSLRAAAVQLAAIAGLNPRIIRDPGRMRPAEQKRMCGNPAKLRALGWTPGIPFEITLRDLLADCRTRVHMEIHDQSNH